MLKLQTLPRKVQLVHQHKKYFTPLCSELWQYFLSSKCTFSGKWDFSEQADLLMVFKSMLLGGLKKDNYKELAKRLNEIGWKRTNDQCRHKVNHIDIHL